MLVTVIIGDVSGLRVVMVSALTERSLVGFQCGEVSRSSVLYFRSVVDCAVVLQRSRRTVVFLIVPVRITCNKNIPHQISAHKQILLNYMNAINFIYS